jgi:hypothetical protein
MDHYVHDYETLKNCFIAVFEHYKTDEVKVFCIHKLKNDLPKLLDFLHDNITYNQWHISFNGLAFDSQITEFILQNEQKLLDMSADDAAKAIYDKAQDCIIRQNNREFQEWAEFKLSIKQIDLFKLNHWDNPAKRSSLKSIQAAMDWHNVQDMPIHHTQEIETIDELKMIAQYCRNDVASTKEVLHRCKDLIKLRGVLTNTYKINLYSASEPKISKELFLYFLSKKLNWNRRDLKQLRTFRKNILFRDIILPYLYDNDYLIMKDVLKNFEQVVLDPRNTRGGFKYSIDYKGVKTDFGLGGIHGARKGVYEVEEGMTIMSSDVTSFYPNLGIRNQWSPAHLPKKEFCEQYEWFFEERKKIPKKDPKNYVYKIVLNSTYGLSNDKNSFLYDPEFTMRITVNGQLSLLLLYVMLAEGVPGAIPIMQNTDGLEMVIPEIYKDKYLDICAEWERITQLQLEHEEYQKLFVPDVNNYIGVFKFKEVDKPTYEELSKDPDNLLKEEDGKYYYAPTKCKGRFEYKGLALHKNKSFQIIPKAIYNYVVHDIEPEEYLKNNRNIFDYIGVVKIKGNWKFIEKKLKEGTLSEEELQNTLRYYVSEHGSKVVKVNKDDGREIQAVAGKWLQTIFNVYEKKTWEDYDVNDRFYLERIYKEIKSMYPERFDQQLTLF